MNPEKQIRMVKAVGFVLLLTSPAWIYALLFSDEYFTPDVTLAMGLPLVLAFNIMLLVKVSEKDPFLRLVMVAGMAAKIAAAGLYLYLAFHVYNYSVDSLHYYDQGRIYAEQYTFNGEWVLLQPYWGSNFLYMLTGNLILLTGPSLQLIMVIFASFSFWGGYFFYRAFCEGVPEGDQRLAALFLFLLPSLVYWTSSVSKDAIICLFLGLSVYGFARLTRIDPRGVAPLGLGLAGVLLVRPHVAVMLSIAYVFPFLAGKHRAGLAGTLGKLVGVPLLVVGTLYLASSAQSFLNIDSFSQSARVFQQVGVANNFGGSAFNGSASLTSRILAAPVLFFRPFPWEAHSVQSVMAGAEGLLMLFISWKRRQEFLHAVKNWRTNPFSFFLMLFVLEFSVIFSAAITNFGLLARERVMALPMLVMLCCTRNVTAAEAVQRAEQQSLQHPWAPAGAAMIWTPDQRQQP